MYQEKDGNMLLVGLVLGAAVGIAAGLLLAPKAGKEMREILKTKLITGKEKVQEFRHRLDPEPQETWAE